MTEVTNNEARNISLSASSFETFLRCISLLQDVCNDVDIHDGIIRQRSNDRSTIFEIDLTTIIEDCTFPMLQIKNKLPLLKLLRGNDVQINLVDGEYFEFSDDFSKFNFKIPVTEYIDNRFMNEDELNSLFQLFNDDIILSTNISTTVSNRIKVVKDVYNTNNIFVEFDGNNASLFSKSDSNDQVATFINDIMTEREINASSPLVSIPFTIDHDGDIVLEMYNNEGNISINKFSTSIESVDITLYSRSELINEEPDDENDEEDPF